MKRNLFLTTAVCVSSVTAALCQAPSLVSVNPPSPNVQAMQKYGDIPVSAYTGIPDISIPIYTAKFRDLTIPINISYHASGIKVAEEASEVGLGWVLNAGGQVSRNIIGADDFLASSNYFTNSIMDMDAGQGPTNKVQQGCNLQMFSSTGQNTIFYYDVSNDLKSQWDFQPDQFYFNFPGHSGKFILTRSFQAIIEKQETISITCQSPTGASWEIRSTDGYTYDFESQETYKDPATNQTHVCAWYLTKITSPTGNTATFNYTPNPSVVQQGIGEYTELRDDYQLSFSTAFLPDPAYPYQYGVTAANIYQNQFLTSIDMPNCRLQFYYSNGRTDLTGDQRLDSVSVFVKDKSGNVGAMPLRTTALTYGYFDYGDVDDIAFGGSNGPNYYQRMKLTQLQNTGYFGGVVSKEDPYVFTYYEGGLYYTMPSKGSFARDHWGYYNGQTGHHSLIPSFTPVATSDLIGAALRLQGPERDPDTGYVKAFSLQSIQYPTGGTTTFEYESNDFDEYNSEVNDNTYFRTSPEIVPATKTFTYDAWANALEGADDTLNLDNEYYVPTFGTVPQITMNAAFRFANSTDCTFSPSPMHAMYFALYDSTGINELQEYDLASYSPCSGGNTNGCYICNSGVFTINQTLTLNPGKYVFKAFNAGNTTPATLETIMVTFNYTLVEQPQPSTFSVNQNGTYYDIGGGLRIKRIIDQDPLDPANHKVRKYIYHYFADKAGTGTPQEYSFGRRMAKPEYSYFTLDLVNYSSDPLNDGNCAYTDYYCLHLLRTADSYNPLNGSAAGAVVGYDQVTELFGENGEYGQKVYRYNNLPDLVYNYGDPLSGQALPMRPPYGSNIPNALNGTLIGETDYSNINGDFIKVKDISNTYQTVLSSRNYVYGLYNTKMNGVNTGDQCIPLFTQICDSASLTYSYISMPSDWQQLASSDEKDFNQGDSTHYLDMYTQYFYDNPVHKLVTRTVTTDSKGEKITSATQYPLDFANPTGTDAFSLGVANLQNDHIIDRPVEKHVDYVNADGSNPRTVNSYLAYFNANSPTESAVYRIEKASPVTNFSPASVSSAGLSSSPFYQPFIYFDQYDAYGNILQQHKLTDFPHSYIWDYASSLPVAEVSNASQTDIAYTSFEADGTGNWSIPSTQTDGTTAITGSQSYNLSNGAISKSGLTVGKVYVISYWSRNGSYTITGGSYTTQTGRTLNNWTYYEHIVTATSTTLTISGTGNIDELRLYPQGALMTTYTYAPLVGITTQADAGDRISYYGYDGLGRLQWIKDQNGNIIKTFQYHYPNN